MARGKKSFSLYLMQVSIAKGIVNVTKDGNLSRLWNWSEKRFDCLAKKNLLPREKSLRLNKCAHGLPRKQKKVSFKSHPPSRKSDLVKLVHSDICCLLKKKSYCGTLYFSPSLMIVWKKVWVYVLKTKNQVPNVFKQF